MGKLYGSALAHWWVVIDGWIEELLVPVRLGWDVGIWRW
jgi:hypothetical protein